MNEREELLKLIIERPDFALGLQERLAKKGIHVGYRIYVLLREMERDGILVSERREEHLAERGGRPRTYYKLAPPKV